MFKNTDSIEKNNKKTSSVLLLDIGSGSIGGAIALFSKKQKPEITYSIRRSLPFSKNLTSQKMVSAMKLTLESMLLDFIKNGFNTDSKKNFNHNLPEYVICTLSAPWHLSTVRDINFTFEAEEEISAGFLSDLLNNESTEFIKKIEESNLIEGQVQMIEEKFINFTINGYDIKNPLNKKTKNFNTKIFLSAGPTKILGTIYESINRYFSGRNVIFRSFSAVYYDTLIKIFPKDERFIAVHISGETTDISVIKDRVIMDTASFPLGRNFMIRELLKEKEDLEPSLASSMIKMYRWGEMDQKNTKQISEIINQVENDWSKLFFEALSDLTQEMFLPTKIFVMSGEDYSQVFADIIQRGRDNLKLTTKQKLNTMAIVRDFFESKVNFTLKDNPDVFFAIQVFYEQNIDSLNDFKRKFLL